MQGIPAYRHTFELENNAMMAWLFQEKTNKTNKQTNKQTNKKGGLKKNGVIHFLGAEGDILIRAVSSIFCIPKPLQG